MEVPIYLRKSIYTRRGGRGGETQKEKEEEIQNGESKEGYMAFGDYVLKINLSFKNTLLQTYF